jgi:D-alanyl-D-alanine carboxypeptidase (penicillin-binding protein 5/6)
MRWVASKLLIQLLVSAIVSFVARPVNSAELTLAAKAAALMDAQTGKLLWAKNSDLPLAPASTVKILAALVVLERSRIDEVVTIPPEALRVSGARAQLKAGEKHSVGDLLHALLLGSGNDAAIALALHAESSLSRFVERMNRKARALGAAHSHFANPTGMPHPSQRTTAHDLALIAKAAMENTELRTIVATRTYPWRTLQRQLTLTNSNKLLDTYEGAIGVKTGNTREAGYCLVAAAERGGKAYIAVVLNSGEKTVWRDASNLLDYGFKRAA